MNQFAIYWTLGTIVFIPFILFVVAYCTGFSLNVENNNSKAKVVDVSLHGEQVIFK